LKERLKEKGRPSSADIEIRKISFGSYAARLSNVIHL
jgi:hypothetical protein